VLTTKKIVCGEFAIFWNNEPTEFLITNVCRGLSGFDKNVYAIENLLTKNIRVIGSLSQAKKSIILTLKQRSSK
jgi:hypothetical protein